MSQPQATTVSSTSLRRKAPPPAAAAERPLRDLREFPLGFYEVIPGETRLSRDEAKALIKTYKKKLLQYLVGEIERCPSAPGRSSVGCVDVVSRPQIVFRGERLVVPSSIAQFFAIVDIKVGNRSQLANSTALPASTFAENAVGVRLSLDTATVAQDIALVVENVSPDTQTFIAALIGTAAQ
jgi:hypothetical protein